MTMRRIFPVLLALTCLLVPTFMTYAQSDTASSNCYVITGGLDLTLFLPPPPLQASDQTRREIEEILRFQSTRTKSMVAAAQADQELSAFRFADVLGPQFNKTNLPSSATFFTRVVNTAATVVEPAKSIWNRPRPYDFDSRVRPCVSKPTNSSYPSGHATVAYVLAIVLAQIVPEKSAALFARAQEFAVNRVVGGVHYRSDIEAGRICGTLLAAALFNQPGFIADLSEARTEVRSVLGYQSK
jgi:acid phosphatase (class A)